MLFAPIAAMSALGVPCLARRCYAAFFKAHIIMAAATLVAVAFHGFGAALAAGIMPLAIPGGLLWLVDIALRAAFGTRAPPRAPPGRLPGNPVLGKYVQAAPPGPDMHASRSGSDFCVCDDSTQTQHGLMQSLPVVLGGYWYGVG